MTHHTDAQLLPCPFCGCKAHFKMDDYRWEWIECGSCGMQGNRSASLMEGCKPKLAEAWNRRTPASQAQRVPLDAYSLREIFKKLNANHDEEGWNFGDLVREVEVYHGITQEKQG